MNFTFGPQPGQILFFHGAPAGVGDESSAVPVKQPPVAMERTDYNSPSPLARFTFATHRTFVSSHQGDTAAAADKGTDGQSGSKEGREPNLALAFRCSKEYRMHMHSCHGELSRLYSRLENGVP